MLKTHKPRGHFWTCPSLFQQSKEIRSLSFEDFTPPASKVLAVDSDDELQPKQRAAKRRRVEHLAEEFLNGQPLIVSCVRPHPSTLKGSLERNERARTSGPYVLPAVELPDDDEVVWADLDDTCDLPGYGNEVPQSKASQSKAPIASKQSKTHRNEVVAPVETVTEDQASSACKQARPVRIVKISLDPSAEAFEQAAALRARRLQKAAPETLRLSSVLPTNIFDEPNDVEPPSDEDTATQSRQIKDRKPRSMEWLLRRQTRLHELSADESMDELNRSRAETPPRPSQLTRQANSNVSLAHKPTAENINYGSSAREACDTSDFAQVSERVPHRLSLGSCQDNWAYSSGASDQEVHNVDDVSRDEASYVRGAFHTAPEVTGVEPAPESIAPLEASEGDSPIRLLRRQGIHAAPPRSWTATNEFTPAKPSPSPVQSREGAPILDLSFGNDAFVPKLNLALTDEHLNAVLPSEPNSARRSSAIKRAIRRELEDSGAEILRADDEPASSQVDGIVQAHAQPFNAVDVAPFGTHTDQAEEIEDRDPAGEVAQTQWPGTQALLHQAREDFFRSPDKIQNATGCESADTPDPSEAYAASAPPSVLREPLGLLPQEVAPPLPSTQAMVEAWSPWSPVKKPRAITARASAPSPTIVNMRKPSRLAGHPASVGDGERRRSSLRFSTSAIESPSMHLSFTVTKPASLESGTKQSASFSPRTADSPSTARLPFGVNMAP
ncbi:hypothetical protein LTR35_011623 [Friedmanniomyces endolithicus]|nr:hypothetical protein LTR35_011623 [Friedmanniomyces endolithicus]KAK0287758.1 hypothetical protein LTS00_009870 [Friedmanniomyces endolithicus]KAK0994632.1 hypothetical protein LTR54_010729 [Friedmanniomyces endolithicus]